MQALNRHFTVYRRVQTTKPPEQVFESVEHSLRSTVGGDITRNGNVFKIFNGNQNLNFGFAADIYATVTLLEPSPGTLELNGEITLEPNQLFWIMAILGFFCLWFLWAFNILYFIMDPRINYQLALDRVNLEEGTASAGKPFGV
ncbi:hypothetical protein [Bremerella alba]|uniref:Uncharacterized protein n=1 Tax=Bremerella alba TaxID=980252 RepID=A0A7V9A5E5_9BACT|nr:hypothetical protein [Bremerella alba]MBA2113270.1 hypothetical protein [Bremerella alba]